MALARVIPSLNECIEMLNDIKIRHSATLDYSRGEIRTLSNTIMELHQKVDDLNSEVKALKHRNQELEAAHENAKETIETLLEGAGNDHCIQCQRKTLKGNTKCNFYPHCFTVCEFFEKRLAEKDANNNNNTKVDPLGRDWEL